MPSDNVIPLNPAQPGGRMADSDYDAERRRIRETYGESANTAGVRWEHELAALFHRSGWTLAELAHKEGKSVSWVDQRVRFGRFLAVSNEFPGISTSGGNLTERRFRELWDESDRNLSEAARFREVAGRLTQAAQNAEKRSNPAGQAIREKYMDGKWRSATAMATALKLPLSEVKTALDLMVKRVAGGYRAERKPVAKDHHYRIFPKDKTVSVVELIEELGPLIQRLEVEGKKSQMTISKSELLLIGSEIKALLSKWSQ